MLQGSLNKSVVLIAIRRSRVVSNDVVGISSSSLDSVKIPDTGRASYVSCDSREAIIETIKLYTLHARCGVSWRCLNSAKILVF